MLRKAIHKTNLIELANHHRKYCEGENCNISLFLLLEMAERAGLEFTPEERKSFI